MAPRMRWVANPVSNFAALAHVKAGERVVSHDQADLDQVVQLDITGSLAIIWCARRRTGFGCTPAGSAPSCRAA